MDEIKELKDRVEKLEQEQQALRKQIQKLLNEKGEREKRRNQKPRIVVGPSERVLPGIKPSKPRPGDPFCS